MNKLPAVRSHEAPELLSKARALLAEAKTLHEVLHVRSLAKAAEKYLKAAKQSSHVVTEAVELQLRSERKAGEILVVTREQGERAGKGQPKEMSRAVTLPELEIDRMQSSRWQQIYNVPEPVFEQYIEEGKSRKFHKLTTAGLLGTAKIADRSERAEQIRNAPPPLPEGPFQVLVIDPPWSYASRADDASHRSRNPYPDMTLEEIQALPVPQLATADSILWLWTTNAFLRAAFDCLDAWDFEHKTVLTWVKNQMGTGDWLRGQTEHCLLAVRGRPIVTLTNQTTALVADRKRHSEKPEEFYLLVESLCPGSKAELFARRRREGWIAYGAEVDGDGQL